MTLTEYLQARIAEDKAAAQECLADDSAAATWVPYGLDPNSLIPSSENPWIMVNPARVLAECEAKRQIVALHVAEPGQHPDFCGHDLRELPCPTIRLLALPYTDRPDFEPGWRP